MFVLFIWTTRSFPDRLLMVKILISSHSSIPWTMQWSLATKSCSWNLLKTSCVYLTLHCFSMGHGVINLGVVWRLALSAFNSSWRWHSKAVSNLSQNSIKLNFLWMKWLKKEFALSDRDVVLSIHARGMSKKYTGIHDSQMANLVENQWFSISPW